MSVVMARYSGAALWLGFFAVVLMAWLALFLAQPGAVEAEFARLYGSDFLSALCAPLTGNSSFLPVFAMWALMSAAMMAPTFVPTLKTYRDLRHSGASDMAGFAALLAAYLATWLVFSALAALAQLTLARAGLIAASGVSGSLGLTAIILTGAGIYQFTTLKEACLSQCRAPLMFFMEHWRPGVTGAFRMGWKLGMICLGCCWALMTLGFVGGAMNLVWMGIATLLMTLEKLPEIGRVVTRPLGACLIGAGVLAALQAMNTF